MKSRVLSLNLVILNWVALLLLGGCISLAATPVATESGSSSSSPPVEKLAVVSPGLPSATPGVTPTLTSSPTATRPPTSTPTPIITKTPAATATTAAACACGRAECACAIEHVIIISIDGLRPDALELAETPVLDALRRAGAYSPRAQSVLPSVTLVNHASMLGGMSPDKHGISWNESSPGLGKVRGPTVFSVAHENGFKTAMVVGKPKLEHLVLLDSVDLYLYAGFTDRQVLAEVLPVIQQGLPGLLFIHLPDVDSAGHLTGWMMAGQIMTIGLTDSVIGEMVGALAEAGYLDQTLLIITSDHGGSDFAHGSDSPEDMTIPWLAVGPGVPAGVILSQEITTYDTAATALSALGLPIPENWDGKPVEEIFHD